MRDGTPDTRTAHEITRQLRRAASGDRGAFDEVFDLIYDQLKIVAKARLAVEREGHTLNATALVHEAYFRLAEQDRVEWQSRAHFLAVAAQAMRRILIDYARRRKAARYGGGQRHVPLEAAAVWPDPDALTDGQVTELIALDDALERLSAFDARGAQVVQYRFFGGLTNPEIAEVLGTSGITVRRSWTMSKAWLRGQLGDGLLGGTETLLGGEGL